METNSSTRIEQTFHDQMWGLANDSMKVERAVSDGRDIAYEILKRSDDEALRYLAGHWLDTHGRDRLRDEQWEAAGHFERAAS